MHDHGHHGDRDTHTVRLVFSIILNLLSDALPNFTDTSSLAVSLWARKLANRSPNADMT